MKRMSSGLLLSSAWLAAAILAAAHAADDIVIADFEGPDYGAWKVEGDAFGAGPAHGALPGQMEVSGFRGHGLVNSFYHGDASTGKLTSPEFRVERRYLQFLIGGGKNPGKLCVNLLQDGRVVRTATGPNDRPGGSERLEWAQWDVEDLAGKTVRVEIVDQATGGWGHINVDEIKETDRKLPELLVDAKRELRLTHRYLNLPVKTGAPKRRVTLFVDGKTAREFEIELADDRPDFWAFLDLSPFQGKAGTLQVDRLPDDSHALQHVTVADDTPGLGDVYREAHRPQFHFSSKRGWLNDPNGLVFHDGEYHLYYQHNPYGWDWGNMHWGHAVSRDLVHWEELPIAVYPHQFGDWAFSGSATVDEANTSGFKTGPDAPIVAAYTSTGRGECILYSNDRGRTFTEFAGNPVVKHQGRDPKLIWYAPGKHWVMAVYDEQGPKRGIAFYTSPDMKQWTRQSWIEGYFECPELFELSVDGDARHTRWVLHAADGAYQLGSFDGKQFTPDGPKIPANWGNCFYASQTYSNVPGKDGRRIRVGWGTVRIPSMPFNQMMDFPVELTLRTTDEGVRMFAVPAREVAELHGKHRSWKDVSLTPGTNPLSGQTGDLWDVRAELDPGEAQEVGLTVRGVPVVYHVKEARLTCGDRSAPLKAEKGRIRLRLLVDRTSIEIFGNDGRVYMPMGVIPADDNHSLEVFARGGKAKIHSLDLSEMRSAWK